MQYRMWSEGVGKLVVWSVRWAGLLVLLMGSSGLGQVAFADQGDGGYPWADAPTSGLFNDWYVDENGNGRRDGGAEEYDDNGFAYRNCTSFVAWKLESRGVKVPFGHALGHGGTWDDNAPRYGFKVDNRPKVGDAAVWNRGRYGHVAYVEAVDTMQTKDPGDDRVTISEYNTLPLYGGRYSRRANLKADAYIHFTPEAPSEVGEADSIVDAPPEIIPLSKLPTPTEVTTQQAASQSESSPSPLPTEQLAPNYSGAQYLIADINGDGSDNVVAVIAGDDTTSGALLWQAGDDPSLSRVSLLPQLTGAQWYVGDVTGDGGDELIAVVSSGEDHNIYVSVNSGGSFNRPVAWGSFNLRATDILVGDKDGDGRADIYVLYQQGRAAPQAYWLRSTGKAFTAPKVL